MPTTNNNLIVKTTEFVKKCLIDAEAGHDWFHIERVLKTAQTIAKLEGGDLLVISLAALLHDIADPKFHNGNEEIGPTMAAEFLSRERATPEVIEHVQQIIRHISFKNSFDNPSFESTELWIVRDADRLDALGAIGIARAFTYGGYKNRLLYDPSVPIQHHHTKDSYKNTTAPTIHHFYEKLLRLKDLMHTQTGKNMANKRHAFMELYLAQFFDEWEGKK